MLIKYKGIWRVKLSKSLFSSLFQMLQEVDNFVIGFVCPVRVKPCGESIKFSNRVEIKKFICPIRVKLCGESITLQSPIFGYLWGTSIPWFRVPRGYPFRGGKWAPYQYHGTVECKTHTIPHSYQYHVTYHTIPYQTIPFDLIPYHQGCLGSFYQIWKVFLQAAIRVHWAPSFVDRFFRFLLSF